MTKKSSFGTNWDGDMLMGYDRTCITWYNITSHRITNNTYTESITHTCSIYIIYLTYFSFSRHTYIPDFCLPYNSCWCMLCGKYRSMWWCKSCHTSSTICCWFKYYCCISKGKKKKMKKDNHVHNNHTNYHHETALCANSYHISCHVMSCHLISSHVVLYC